MNYICTWFCADEKGEESIFPQTGQKSSGIKHQEIYWRCVLLFFATSRRFNKEQKHIFFTNVRYMPLIDEKSVGEMLTALNVEVVITNFKYKTPKGYFQMFQNQFYEFSILEYIATHGGNEDDQYLIMDSDCVFTRSAKELFDVASSKGFLSFEDDCTTDLIIHGLSRIDMKSLYEELLGKSISEIPGYHLGEFFLASKKNIKVLFSGFLEIWPEMITRHSHGRPKFNEEAQTLSYLYYKNGFAATTNKTLAKRIWTNPVFYRNVDGTEPKIAVWHLPAEKTYGLADLYQILVHRRIDFGLSLTDAEYLKILFQCLGVPYLSPLMILKYYSFSYYRALSKRAKKAPILKRFF